MVAPVKRAKIPGLGLGEAVGEGDAVGEGEAVGDGDAVGETLGDGVGELVGEPVGETLGVAEGDGVVMPKTPAATTVLPFRSSTRSPFAAVGTVCPLSVRSSNCPLPKELTTS